MEQQFSEVCFPGWEVARKIGEGSFGKVYEIHRTLPDGRVEKAALKKLTIPQDRSEIDELYAQNYDSASITEHYKEQMQELVQEYRFLRELSKNAYVVHCQDLRIVQHDDRIGWDIYIQMELLTPLTTWLPEQYDERKVIRLGMNLCGALYECHQKSIIHRDIKPENIFVTQEGKFKLGDFGIAKISEKTATGTLIGTYSYMAPEVANRQHYGAPADIYSLGLVLYWMMNEKTLPFLPLSKKIPSGMQRQEAQDRRFSGEEIPPPLNGSLALAKVVLKACAFSTEERYQTAQELRQALYACYQRDSNGVWICPNCKTRNSGKYCTVCGIPHTPRRTNSARNVQHRKTAPKKRWLLPAGIAATVLIGLLCLLLIIPNDVPSPEEASIAATTMVPSTEETPTAAATTVPYTQAETEAIPETVPETTEITETQKADTAEAPVQVPFVQPEIPPESELYHPADYAKAVNETNLFSVMPRAYSRGSGAGGGGTALKIYEDGSFEGDVRDYDLGSVGAEYPEGTCDICEFTGSFTSPRKVSDYIYSVRIKNLNYPKNYGSEWIEDGRRYIQCGPGKLAESKEYYIYLPGCLYEDMLVEKSVYFGYQPGERIAPGRFAIYDVEGPQPSDLGIQLGYWGLDGTTSIYDCTYEYTNGTYTSTLSPSRSGRSYFSKSNLHFYAGDKFAFGLDLDWEQEDQRHFTATDTAGTGEYSVDVYVAKDMESALVVVQSMSGQSLEAWGGTSDGKLAATYQRVRYNADDQTVAYDFSLDKSTVEVGAYVRFGCFEQDNNPDNGEKPIEWRVLAQKDNRALLISRYALTARCYHNEALYPTWANSNIRQWLNGIFFLSSFTEKEQSAIIRTKLSTADYEGVGGGPDTWDHVFLLSRGEAATYFTGSEDRLVKATEYARSAGAAVADENGCCWWWLRTPGTYAYDAGTVYAVGGIDHTGSKVTNATITVRPAIWVKLS